MHHRNSLRRAAPDAPMAGELCTSSRRSITRFADELRILDGSQNFANVLSRLHDVAQFDHDALLIKSASKLVSAGLRARFEPTMDVRNNQRQPDLKLTDWACTVKHGAFSEEKEWRIITYPKGATLVGVKPADYEGFSVRPTARLLLPLLSLETSSPRRLPLLEIRCGPSQFLEPAAQALHILLRKHGDRNLPG